MSRREVNLAFEILEPKLLLAGNVEVEETGAGLKIAGDTETNYIRIERVNADTVAIRGADGTTVNGAASRQFAIGGGSVKLDFKQGGNDTVEIYGAGGADLELSKVKGRFGNGNDEVSFSAANTTRQVGLKMGDGNNRVHAGASSLNGKVKIQTGQGEDRITLLGAGGQALGKTSIAAGEGRDSVNVSGFAALAQLTVSLEVGADEFLGAGNIFLGKAAVDGGVGDDTSSGTGNTFAPGSPLVTSVETRTQQW